MWLPRLGGPSEGSVRTDQVLDAVSRLLTTIRWPGALLCQPYTASTHCSQCSRASLALATVPQCS